MGPGGPMSGGPPSMQSPHLQNKPLFPSAAAIVSLTIIKCLILFLNSELTHHFICYRHVLQVHLRIVNLNPLPVLLL